MDTLHSWRSSHTLAAVPVMAMHVTPLPWWWSGAVGLFWKDFQIRETVV